MDEFDKIKELSEDIVGRKEPTFSSNSDDSDDYQLNGLEEMPPLTALTEKDSGIKWSIWGIGIAGLILIAVIGGIALSGSDSENDQIPVIAPTLDPVRVKPDNPGGLIIPDQDKTIYNRLNPKEAPAKVEKLFPEPEKPVFPEILIKQNTPEQPFIETDQIPAINPLDTMEEPIVATANKKQGETLPLPEKIAEPTPKAENKSTASPKKETVKEVSETWRVQLFSTSKKAAAEKAWNDISKKQKALLSDMSHEIVAAEIAGKGTFYRVQAGQFATKEMAANLCKKLKAKKQDCVPVKK